MSYDKEFYEWARLHPADVSAVGINNLLDEIERLQSLNRWIPVSERLPETDTRIEFFGGFEQTTHIGYYREHATQWESENGGFWHEHNCRFITHWRPLPQPEEVG